MAIMEPPAVVARPDVPVSNQTILGLYATPREAYEMWKADPDTVTILDVRSFEEYVFVGHFEFARNIPLVYPKYHTPDPNAPAAPAGPRPPGCYGVPNEDFIKTAKELSALCDTILVTCTTGARGAMAVNMLAQAGFTKVYNIVTGFEGDRVDDPGSYFHGKHHRNGWKNAGLPWTYDFHPDLMWSEEEPA